jgi:glutamyl-tRNA synthetase
MSQKVRVRFAPSPTGALHIGGVRTALYNYLFAKQHGGTFILRIEDTDQTRYVSGAEDYIIESLRWCGIEPTEGIGFGDGEYAPYRQSDRKAIYQEYALQLVKKGKAYYAFDTAEQLEAKREALKAAGIDTFQYGSASRLSMNNSLTLTEETVKSNLKNNVPYTIRLQVPENEVVKFTDLIRGEVEFNTNELDDKVLLKSDGMPTYHLANIVDDYMMKITHVIRGEEWLPSTGHHVLLYKAFGWSKAMPQFSHLPLILKPNGNGKLSKRDGAKFGIPVFPLGWTGTNEEDSFKGFREYGFLPEALINFLAFVGWSSGTDKEIFSLEELVTAFSMERINKAGARFDFEKAKWFNQQYIQKSNPTELAAYIRPYVAAKGYEVSEAYLQKVGNLLKERVVFLGDFVEKGYYLFEPVRSYDQAAIQKRWKPENLSKFEALTDFIASQTNFEALALETAVKEWLPSVGLKVGEVLPMLRIALAGTMEGPGVFDMANLLEKEETVARLTKAFASF